jgi:two-component system nitrogen regulation response regulator NtrX
MNEAITFKILIVDDEEIVRLTMTEQFSYLGYRALAVENGLLGIRELQNEDYDAVFVDLKMPVLDGMEFLRQVRDLYPDLPVIVMTGHGSDETGKEVLASGAFAFLKKPFRLDDIRALLKRLETGNQE